MHIRTLRFALAPAALAIATFGAPLARAEDTAQPGSLEIKHVGDDDSVQVEIGPTPKTSVKLVPFPEDLEESSDDEPAKTATPAGPSTAESTVTKPPAVRIKPTPRKTVERLPATAISPNPDFRPRFKVPAVRQAQHLEPVTDEAQPAESAVDPADATLVVPTDGQSTATIREETPGAAEPAAAPTEVDSTTGKALIEDAFGKSKTAASDSDYSDIIELCRHANKEGLRKHHQEYANRLMSWAYNRRGELRAGESRDQEALADFEAAFQLNETSWRAVHNRGVSYAALGRVDEALADFERTIKLNPKYHNAYFNRGELLYSQGKYDEAIGNYSVALQMHEPDAGILSSRGHAFYRMKRYGEALRDYAKALELDPNNAAALVNRGDTYSDLGRYADAAADYRAAITADPQMGRAYQAAAWLMATCSDDHYRNDKLAIEAATKAIAIDGETDRNLETLAAAQANAGQFAEAKTTQEKAIAKVAPDQLVAAEKRMALYQREVAFREMSPQQMVAAKEVRKQTEAEKKKFPVQRASANVPDAPESVSYPEDAGDIPGATMAPPARGQQLEQERFLHPDVPADEQPGAQGQQPKRRLWPFGAPKKPQGRPRMSPKAPTHPLGRN